MMDYPILLENQIQDYAWGSKTAIQDLTGVDSNGTPWAELWMGAHPKAPSSAIVNEEKIPLDVLIRRYPEWILGREAARKFNSTLPFLFKVLAAAQPLSIQAHPDRRMAEAGFHRENLLDIPINAPHRNYRDPWPKPEIICAVEPFVALTGFRPASSIIKWFDAVCPEMLSEQIGVLKKNPDQHGIKRMFSSLIRMPADQKKSIIAAASESATKIDAMESEWVLRLMHFYPDDIGVLSPLFLNLIQLEPATAMYLPPGQMHAYLEGVGIELMANSDNVLRGGLTGKHLDIEELMDVVRFDPSPVEILRPIAISTCESYYPADAEEFVLSVVHAETGAECRSREHHGLEILLCMEGAGSIVWMGREHQLALEKGTSVLIPASMGSYRIQGNGMFFKAAIPRKK